MKKFKVTINFDGKEESMFVDAIDEKDALIEVFYQMVLVHGKEFLTELSKRLPDGTIEDALDMTDEVNVEEVE